MVSKYVEQADRVVLAETTSVSSLISTKSNLLHMRVSQILVVCWARGLGLSPAQNKESEHNKASKHPSIGE